MLQVAFGGSLCAQMEITYWQVNFPSTYYHTGLWYIHITIVDEYFYKHMSL